jgi:hypothetical protein
MDGWEAVRSWSGKKAAPSLHGQQRLDVLACISFGEQPSSLVDADVVAALAHAPPSRPIRAYRVGLPPTDRHRLGRLLASEARLCDYLVH